MICDPHYLLVMIFPPSDTLPDAAWWQSRAGMEFEYNNNISLTSNYSFTATHLNCCDSLDL